MTELLGPTLESYVKSHPQLSWPQRIRLMHLAVAAMERLRGQGVVHNDIKAANLLMTIDCQDVVSRWQQRQPQQQGRQ